MTNETWAAWKEETNAYFVPDFDDTAGYYQADPGWWAYWGGVVDGVFSWEAAWPERAGLGGEFPGDVGPDEVVAAGAEGRGKAYMVGEWFLFFLVGLLFSGGLVVADLWAGGRVESAAVQGRGQYFFPPSASGSC